MGDVDLPRRRCRGTRCRAEIILAPTVTTVMPLDATPNPAGNVVLGRDLLGGVVAHVVAGSHLELLRASGRDLYMPHHATCPDVEEFRR